jgi:transposase
MPIIAHKIKVLLSAEQRAILEEICRSHTVGAAKQRRARILLLSDDNQPDGGSPDRLIAERVGLCERQVVRIRQRFVREGDESLARRPRPPVTGKLDGKAEAHLIALACSAPPEGHDAWTLQMLCDELGRLKLVESVCCETVRKSLKKTRCSLGGSNDSASQKQIGLGSSRGWKKSSMSTKRNTTKNTR